MVAKTYEITNYYEFTQQNSVKLTYKILNKELGEGWRILQ